MPDYPIYGESVKNVITSFGVHADGVGDAMVGKVVPAATAGVQNRLYLCPFTINIPIVVTRIGWYNGSSVAGTILVAIYDVFTLRLLVSGSATQTGTSTPQDIDITDTTLNPGNYWMGIASTGATVSLFAGAPDLVQLRTSGMQEQSSIAGTLPATLTPGNQAAAYVPFMSITTKTVFI